MKTTSMLLLLVACISIPAFGQDTETTLPVKKWTVSSLSLTAGLINDRYINMDLETMRELTSNPALLDRNLDGYTEQLSRNSTGIKIGANLSLRSASQTANGFDREIRLGAFYSAREPMVSYNNTEGDVYNSIIFCNMVNEISADGAFILSKRSARFKRFRMYTGLGMSVGSTFNTKSVVITSSYGEEPEDITNTEERYQGESSLISRLYIPLGIEFSPMKRIAIGLESNIGTGMQNIYGGKSYFMPISATFQTKLSYNF